MNLEPRATLRGARLFRWLCWSIAEGLRSGYDEHGGVQL